MLWVALFGVIDELVSLLHDVRERLLVYLTIGLCTVVVVLYTDGITFCSLQ